MGTVGEPAAPPAPHWLGTLLYVPLLLAAGWLLARPLALLSPGMRPDQLDLAGAVIALGLLLLTLPGRLRRLWGEQRPWRRLGLALPWTLALRSGGRGLLTASVLLLTLSAGLMLSGQARWLGDTDLARTVNGLALGLGVGFAEELLFRGWLWGELELRLAPRHALGLQGLIFALVHPWYRAPGLLAPMLLGGLTLLGLALALERRLQGGSLWASIALHGGLVGGWFVLQSGLMGIAPGAPGWWTGPGDGGVNPLGGVLGWIALAALLAVQRTAVARARRPSTGACRASSRGARP